MIAVALNKGRSLDEWEIIRLSFRDDLAYLKSIWGFILLTVLAFLASAVMGYFAASADPDLANIWMDELEMLKWIMELHPLLIMLVIFLKNLTACAMSVLLGLGFGLVPLLVLTTNGIMIGMVSYLIIHNQGVLYLLAGIVPHGIIELPTILLGISIGFRLGYLLIFALLGEKVDLAGETRTAVHFLIKWFAPLLFVAAAIETFITPIAISVVT
jgi:stage II sporulation protein M